MRDAGWLGMIKRTDGGQSRMGSLGAGWRRVSRELRRSSRRRVGEHDLGIGYTARPFA